MITFSFKLILLLAIIALGAILMPIVDFFEHPRSFFSFVGRWTLYGVSLGHSDLNRQDRIPVVIGFLITCIAMLVGFQYF